MRIKTGIGANNNKMANMLVKCPIEPIGMKGKTDSKETLKEGDSVESKSTLRMKRAKDSETSSSFDEPEMLGLGNCAADLRHYSLKQQKFDTDCNTHNKILSRVLVICTGGTLTMVHTPRGYMA